MSASLNTLEVRDVRPCDSDELADLLNAIIAKGGTTALEEPFTAEELAQAYLIGSEVYCCFVAINPATGRIEGFQMLCRYPKFPDEIGDIGTFARINGSQRGVGTALFDATRTRARALGLPIINATIRADNTGGLAFYRKQGFVDHDVLEGVPMKDGTRIDRVVKRYTLMQAEID
jgi:L-amino acid N-acyltransferase YncA